MGDLIKNILKFALVILILILLIVILAKLANKKTPKKELLNTGVQTIEKQVTKVEDTILDTNTNEENTTQVVETPDTATNSSIYYLVGTTLLMSGIYSVIRTQKDS